jgi:hypothetical protein
MFRRRQKNKTTLEAVQERSGAPADEYAQKIRDRIRSLETPGLDGADADEVEARIRNLSYGSKRETA